MRLVAFLPNLGVTGVEISNFQPPVRQIPISAMMFCCRVHAKYRQPTGHMALMAEIMTKQPDDVWSVVLPGAE